MLVLLNQSWPWIVFGILLTAWGLNNLQLNFVQWIKVCFSVIFGSFSEPTKKEKRIISATPLDEVMGNNFGCTVILLGITCIVYGLIREIM